MSSSIVAGVSFFIVFLILFLYMIPNQRVKFQIFLTLAKIELMIKWTINLA